LLNYWDLGGEMFDEVMQIELRQEGNKDKFLVYPNPAKNSLKIICNTGKETKFNLVNSIGNVVDIIKVNGEKNLNIVNYPEGIYFLVDKSGEMQTMKFIIIK